MKKDREFYLKEWKPSVHAPSSRRWRDIAAKIKRWGDGEAGIVDFCIAYWCCVAVVLCVLLFVWLRQ